MSTSGSSTVALATAYSMIRSAKPWRARSRALPSSAADVGAQRRRCVAKSPRLAEEVLVELGLDLLAELLEVDREVGRLAGQGRLAVVLGEGDVEVGRLADAEADEVGLEARDEPLLAEDQRHPLGLAALERLAVAACRRTR